jgi:hypothetical protein
MPDLHPYDRPSTQADIGALAARLAALERQNRRLKQIVAAAALGVAAVSVAGAGAAQTVQPPTTTITGDRLVLVDPQNRTRATLTMQSSSGTIVQQPLLTFFDAAGRPRLRTGLGQRGAILEVVDENGKAKDFLAPAGVRPLTQP